MPRAYGRLLFLQDGNSEVSSQLLLEGCGFRGPWNPHGRPSCGGQVLRMNCAAARITNSEPTSTAARFDETEPAATKPKSRSGAIHSALRTIGATWVPRISMACNIFWCGRVETPIWKVMREMPARASFT